MAYSSTEEPYWTLALQSTELNDFSCPTFLLSQLIQEKEENYIFFNARKYVTHYHSIAHIRDFPGGASGKESTCQCRRHKRCDFDPWVGTIPWRGHGDPLRYSCLENPMDRGARPATDYGVAKSQTQWKNSACTQFRSNWNLKDRWKKFTYVVL